jgi:hypothetical protein
MTKVEKLKKQLEDLGYGVVLWHYHDVLYVANMLERKITQDQAKEILQVTIDNHDCNYGITWESFKNYLPNE